MFFEAVTAYEYIPRRILLLIVDTSQMVGIFHSEKQVYLSAIKFLFEWKLTCASHLSYITWESKEDESNIKEDAQTKSFS